ncbi:hypothetical protein [Adhaeretor mobilis]|uniref:Uncharacterized protein n=1 Tax=Adhaeretor mobilis TaxID=1930276 RepID=A0A517MQG8_9BACT|nr:hypothetical protein [Adhaeretor mobilis]QDS97128.1 hypothetical protein HG15A2_03880 [Adhaeretor mobilis]
MVSKLALSLAITTTMGLGFVVNPSDSESENLDVLKTARSYKDGGGYNKNWKGSGTQGNRI